MVSDSLRAGIAGVANGVIHAPGGRGVLIAVSLAFRLEFGVRAGGVRSLSTSSEDEGGSGKSGIPLGGDGVRNSIFETFDTLSRFGVASNAPGITIEGDGGEVSLEMFETGRALVSSAVKFS